MKTAAPLLAALLLAGCGGHAPSATQAPLRASAPERARTASVHDVLRTRRAAEMTLILRNGKPGDLGGARMRTAAVTGGASSILVPGVDDQ